MSFKEAGVEVDCVSPLNVVQFYQSHTTRGVLSALSLPSDINNTPFRNVQTLQTVIQYCLQVRQFIFFKAFKFLNSTI